MINNQNNHSNDLFHLFLSNIFIWNYKVSDNLHFYIALDIQQYPELLEDKIHG